MQLVSHYIRHAPKGITCAAFCRGVTAYIRRHYRRSLLSQLTQHPEDRLCASAVIFSRLNREVWLIGDCHCLLTPLSVTGHEDLQPLYYDNPKPYEQQLAEERAAVLRSLFTPEQLRRPLPLSDKGDPIADPGRERIIPHMKETMKQQNIQYSVIDGFPIPMQHVRIITLDFRPWEIVLASDGYPFLESTLAASEERLAQQRKNDPLNIGHFKATKSFLPNNSSFDDRAYIRFRI